MKASMRAQPAAVVAADASKETERELSLDKDSFPLDRYKPIYELGSGASGVVFLARDRVLGKKVAIKILRSLSPSIVMAFQEEARTTSRLKHKYIVDLLDFGVTPGGAPYMVLEFILGPSLEEVVHRVGPIRLRDFFSVFERTCEALSYAHANKVFHRDLKPGNILLTNETDGSFSIRVIDFGLAKILSDQADADQNKQLTIVGTPLYMSPDQGLGRPFDARSEVYSLGCVMFEALTGAPPFEADTALELLNLHAEVEPPRLTDVLLELGAPLETAAVPDSIESLVRKCLEKDPDDRFQNIDEVHSALLDAQQNSSGGSAEAADEAFVKTNKSLIWVTGATALLTGFAALSYIIVSNSFVDKNPTVKRSDDRTDVDLQFAGVSPGKSLASLIDPNQEIVRLSGALKASEIVGLERYKYITDLDLSNNVHNDDVTAQIKAKYLKVLRLNNTPVKTLEYVSKLKNLQRLNLASSSIDVEAIKRLKNLPNLTELDVRDTNLTPEDLNYLADIPTLQKLSVSTERYSPAVLLALHARLPGCDMGLRERRIASIDEIRKLVSSGNFAGAATQAKKAIDVVERIQGKEAPIISSYCFWAACAARGRKKYEEAKQFSKRSILVARKNNFNVYLPDSYSNLMQTYDETKQSEVADEYVEPLIDALKERDGYSRKGAEFTLRAAEKYFRKQDWFTAQQWFLLTEKYLKNLQARKVKFENRDYSHLFAPLHIHLSEVKFNLGDRKGSKERALFVQDMLKKHPIKFSDGPDEYLIYKQMLALCETRLAACAASDKDFEKAIRHQRKSIEYLNEVQAPAEGGYMYLKSLETMSKENTR